MLALSIVAEMGMLDQAYKDLLAVTSGEQLAAGPSRGLTVHLMAVVVGRSGDAILRTEKEFACQHMQGQGR